MNVSLVQYYYEKTIRHSQAWFQNHMLKFTILSSSFTYALYMKRLEHQSAHPPENQAITFKLHPVGD
jgi:hypothetical protein